MACVDKSSTVQRGTCTEMPPSSGPTTPVPDAQISQPPDTSCDDLRTFCDTNCTRPATVAADCQATVDLGDPPTCATWQAVNGLLCSP
jgi:hypothetical protein